MNLRYLITLSLLILLSIFSCENKGNDQVKIENNKLEFFQLKTLDDILMIYKFIPISSDYDQIKKHYPNLSELRAYARIFLVELDTTVFDFPTILEFKFNERDKLIGIQFKIVDTHCSDADSLYKYLQNYYVTQFGDYREEVEKDPSEMGYPIEHASYWTINGLKLTVFLNEYPGNCELSWDFN